MSNSIVLSPEDFLLDLEKAAKDAKSKVWVQAMYIKPGKKADRVTKMLLGSAGKGLDTRLNIDYYAVLKKYFDPEKEIFPLLRNSKVKTTLTNPPTKFEKIWPYKGRNHIKITIVDYIAYVGGVNFSDQDFEKVDFMIKINNPKTVDEISQAFVESEQGKLQDKSVEIDPLTQILIDRGNPGKSVILTEAINLIGSAKKSVYHLNQFGPDGKLLSSLINAHKKGVKVEAIFPNKLNGSFAYQTLKIWNKFNATARNTRRFIIPSNHAIHAKLTIIDGKTVLFGSHNLSSSGVRFGTAELGIKSKEKNLVKDLIDFYTNIKAPR